MGDKPLRVRIDRLLIAMTDRLRDMSEYYLDTETGHLCCLPFNVRRAFEIHQERAIDRLSDWERDLIPLAKAIDQESPRYLRVPEIDNDEEFGMMVDFAGQVQDKRIHKSLVAALATRRPLAAFREAVADWPDAEHHWDEYERKRQRERAHEWLEKIGAVAAGG